MVPLISIFLTLSLLVLFTIFLKHLILQVSNFISFLFGQLPMIDSGNVVVVFGIPQSQQTMNFSALWDCCRE
jgi:hypothetical protein